MTFKFLLLTFVGVFASLCLCDDQPPPVVLQRDDIKLEVGDGCGGEGIMYVPTNNHHTHTLIFLHGYNDTDNYFLHQLIQQQMISRHWKIIMPYAELLPSVGVRGWAMLPPTETIPKGTGVEDENGYRESKNRIEGLIKNEILEHGTLVSNIAIGGFSQGGALAYLTALESGRSLLGLFGLSCWVPLMTVDFRPRASWPNVPLDVSATAKALPILHLHGQSDRVIPLAWGKVSIEYLRSKGINVELHLFDVGHEINDQEVKQVGSFLMDRMWESPSQIMHASDIPLESSSKVMPVSVH